MSSAPPASSDNIFRSPASVHHPLDIHRHEDGIATSDVEKQTAGQPAFHISMSYGLDLNRNIMIVDDDDITSAAPAAGSMRSDCGPVNAHERRYQLSFSGLSTQYQDLTDHVRIKSASPNCNTCNVNSYDDDDDPELYNLNEIMIKEEISADTGQRAEGCIKSVAGGDRHVPLNPRGRIQIRPIQNPSNRQVTFCKRRRGVLKKAHELSVLCDAHVAVIIFSHTGKLYEFCNSSMEKILERYERINVGTCDQAHLASSLEYWKQEATRCKSELNVVQDAVRCLMGEGLQKLQLKEIKKLERQLREARQRVRSRQTNLLMEQIQELNEKVQVLVRENDMLRAKVIINDPDF